MRHFGRTRLWILIADGRRAHIVVPDATEGHFHTSLWLGVSEYPHCPMQTAQHAGHGHVSQYTRDVALRLDNAAAEGLFDELVLAAPPPVAHGIRAALAAATLARLVGTVDRDLMGLDDPALSPHLAPWWVMPAEQVNMASLGLPASAAAAM